MPIITTKTGKKILRKPESLWLLPYVYNENFNDYVLGQTIYDVSAIIGNSITIEQEDGETQSKTNEFTNEPLVRNVTSGEWKVTAQCLDLQNNVLKALFAAYYNDTAGISAMRGEYETLYALIRIRFSDTSIPDVYLPKVQLNSKLLLHQMRSSGSQGNLGGTALSRECAVIETAPTSEHDGELYGLTDMINGVTLYGVSTPILFVPRDKNVLILNHRDDEAGESVFDEILNNPGNNDCCARNRVVYDDSPSTYTQS